MQQMMRRDRFQLLLLELLLFLRYGSPSALSACNCDCCEVEVLRANDAGEAEIPASELESTERLQCVYAELGLARTSTFRVQPSQCGNLCLRDAADDVLRAAEAPEADMQRFCFFECAPDRHARQGEDPLQGDPCRPLTQAEASRVGDSSGNAVPPMEQPQVSAQFLAHRSMPPRPRTVLSAASMRAGSRLSSGTSSASSQAVTHAAAIAIAGTLAAKAATGAADNSDLQGYMGPQPARAPAPAAAPAGVTPWVSIDDPAPEKMAHIAEIAAEAERMAQEAKDDSEAVKKIADKATVVLPSTLAKVTDAREAALQAAADEKAIRELHDQLFSDARREAYRMLPKLLAKMQNEARSTAKAEAKKRGKENEIRLEKEAQQIGVRAQKRWQEAEKRAEQTAATWKERGNEFAAQAETMTEEAKELGGTEEDPMLGEANRHMAWGDYKAAEDMMVRAHKLAYEAGQLNKKAANAWKTAQSIEATLPAYQREAGQDMLHAEAMHNPAATAPWPLVSEE